MLGVTISDTVNLGTGLLALVIGLATLGRLLYTVPKTTENTSLRRQLGEARGEIEDKTRRLNELGAEKDNEAQSRAAAEERAHGLEERLSSLPDWEAVQRFTRELLEHVDREAARRQVEIAEQFARLADRNDRLAAERQKGVTANQGEMLKLLREILEDAQEAHARRRLDTSD